jgi:hypothetical protein
MNKEKEQRTKSLQLKKRAENIPIGYCHPKMFYL